MLNLGNWRFKSRVKSLILRIFSHREENNHSRTSWIFPIFRKFRCFHDLTFQKWHTYRNSIIIKICHFYCRLECNTKSCTSFVQLHVFLSKTFLICPFQKLNSVTKSKTLSENNAECNVVVNDFWTHIVYYQSIHLAYKTHLSLGRISNCFLGWK